MIVSIAVIATEIVTGTANGNEIETVIETEIATGTETGIGIGIAIEMAAVTEIGTASDATEAEIGARRTEKWMGT